MNHPFFNITIPVYNVADHLPRCLDSVLCQSFIDYEILLIDDGLTDYSSQICFDYARKYPQITFVRQKNAGRILFLDSDDYWQDDTCTAQFYKNYLNIF